MNVLKTNNIKGFLLAISVLFFGLTNTLMAGIPTLDVGAIASAIQQLEQAKKAYNNQLRQHEAILRGEANNLLRYDKEFWKTDIKEINRKLKEVDDMLAFYKNEYKNYADLFERDECTTFEECHKRADKEEVAKIESEKQAVVAAHKELENQLQDLSQTQAKTQIVQKASLKAENQLQATQANTAMLQITNEQLSEVRRLLIMQLNMQKTAEANKIKELQSTKEITDNLTTINN